MTVPVSPLVDIALAMMTESGQHLDSSQLSHVRSLLQGYVTGQVTFQVCLSNLTPFLGGAQSVHKLESILRTPDAPITNSARVSRPTGKTRPWTAYEDQRLLAAIHRFGLQDWAAVALFVGNDRSKAQCSQRWGRGLDPKISKDQWSAEQDQLLLELVATHGEGNWMKVSNDLGTRCDVQCRYRYKQLQKRDDFDEKMRTASRTVTPTTHASSKSRTKTSTQIPYHGIAPFPFQQIVQMPPIPYQNVYTAAPMVPNMAMFQPSVQVPQTASCPIGGISLLGVQTRVVPPVVQLVSQPVPFAPPKNEGQPAQKIPWQPSMGFSDAEVGVSAQNSGLDWKNPFGSSDSTSLLFGISPMNSFKCNR
jgi:hypothetical protein